MNQAKQPVHTAYDLTIEDLTALAAQSKDKNNFPQDLRHYVWKAYDLPVPPRALVFHTDTPLSFYDELESEKRRYWDLSKVHDPFKSIDILKVSQINVDQVPNWRVIKEELEEQLTYLQKEIDDPSPDFTKFHGSRGLEYSHPEADERPNQR